MTTLPVNKPVGVPIRLSISFDSSTFKFKASSPDVNGWTGEAQTVHDLHRQVSRFLKVAPESLSIELEGATGPVQAARADLCESL